MKIFTTLNYVQIPSQCVVHYLKLFHDSATVQPIL